MLGDPNPTNTDTLNFEDAKSSHSNSTYGNGSSRDLQSTGEEIEEDDSEEEQILLMRAKCRQRQRYRWIQRGFHLGR
jgi:hypothetical protein